MESIDTFGDMDRNTLAWLTEWIDTSPDELSLTGCLETVEWFYSIDKDEKSYNYLVNRIKEKQKLL